MSRRLVGTLGAWLLACAALAAADFWEEKDYTSWSAEEVEEMLTDSPWSRGVSVVVRGVGGRVLGPVVGAGGAGDGGARPTTMDGPTRERVADYLVARRVSSNPVPERITLTVSWRSALPVKQALARSQAGVGSPIPPAQQAFLIQHEPLYVVSVSGIPRQFAEEIDRQALLAETTLVRKDKPPIIAEDVEPFFESDETVILEFAFLRDDPITLFDRDVEFSTTLGEIEIGRSFKLQDMMFGDALAM